MIKKVLLCAALLTLAASSGSFAVSVSRDWQLTLATVTPDKTINRIQVYLAEGYDASGNAINQFELNPYALRLANNTKALIPDTVINSAIYFDGTNYTAVGSHWGVANPTGGLVTSTDTVVTSPYYNKVAPQYREQKQNWVNDAKNVAVIEAPSFIKGTYLGIREYWKTAPAQAYAAKVYYQFYNGTTLVGSATFTKAAGSTSWNTQAAANTGLNSEWNTGYININPVPEPGSMLALLTGLGSLAGFIRRKH